MKQKFLTISLLAACVSAYAQSHQSFDAVEFSANPVQAWVARYNGPGSAADVAKAIVVDGSGNIYVTGYRTGLDGYRNYATIKYSNNGVQEWVASYNGPGNNHDEAYAIAVDNIGNVYVTGYSQGVSGTSDYATIKYDDAGVQQWVTRYNGAVSAGDTAVALTIDASGNFFVTGRSIGAGGNRNYVTVKYNGTGKEQWVASYNGSGNGHDDAQALAVDGLGNVYVTGYSYGSNGNYNYATIRYSAAGIKNWVATYSASTGKDDKAHAIAVDDAGNVYVTGSSDGFLGNHNYATLKYNSAGAKQWVARYQGPASQHDDAYAIAVDGFGNVYVTGRSQGRKKGYDYATIKYNNTGDQQWVARYNGPTNKDDEAKALTVDGAGNIYVTGFSTDFAGFQNYTTVQYNSAGVEQWVGGYYGPAQSHDGANAIAVDSEGNVYVTGYSTSANGTTDCVTIKYLASNISGVFSKTAASKNNTLSQSDNSTVLPATFHVAQNLPNPFNPTTTIHFDMPQAGRVKLSVYNLRGELVQTLVDGEISAGAHSVRFDGRGLASGVYFYRMEAGGVYTMTRKMVLQK